MFWGSRSLGFPGATTTIPYGTPQSTPQLRGGHGSALTSRHLADRRLSLYRFPTPLNIPLPKVIPTTWKCLQEHNKPPGPNDPCYIQNIALQELANATLVDWRNASRRQDMRIGVFVLQAGQTVIYETTTAKVLHMVNLRSNYTVKRAQTVRYSPSRFFAALNTNYEQMIVAFDSDAVDVPSQPLYIRDYAKRRFIIRTSRLFAPGKPLEDLSQGNISMPVQPPQAAPIDTPTDVPTAPPQNAPVGPLPPLGDFVPPATTAPIRAPVESMAPATSEPLSQPLVDARATVGAPAALHNDSLYLLDLVIHGPTRVTKFLVTRMVPVVSQLDRVTSIQIPEGGLFAMDLSLDGLAEDYPPAMQITQQPAFQSLENLTKYRPLVLLHDTTRVHIFQLERGLRSGSFNWTDPLAPSLFYVVKNPDLYISAANMFVEPIPRFAGNFFAGSPMWLVVSLTSLSGKNSSINVIALPELASAFENDTRFDDPAQLEGTDALFCDRVKEYYFAGSCVPRMQVWENLNATEPPSMIVTRAVERFVTDVYLPKPLPSAVNIWPLEKPAHSAIFVLSSRHLEIFGLAPQPFTMFDVAFQKMSEFSFVGPVKDLAISPNGLHVFANVYRPRWELDAMDRFADICAKLANPNTSPLERQFLEPGFRKPCDGFYRRPNINDFVQYVGMCPVIGVQCYSFYRTLINKVAPGYYTVNGFEQLRCEPGYFCPGGVKQKCPPGFSCSGFGNIKPTRCFTVDGAQNETCFQDGLTEPIACPPGTACVAPFLPPLPAAPGLYIVNSADRSVAPCVNGEYCLLGRSQNEDRRCPGNFVCNSTAVITPTLCQCNASYCSWCPDGTFEEKACPSGHYCRPSNTSIECQPPAYCPEGTSAPELCPAGFYCPTPSDKIICPAGYFCSIGSIDPIKCSVFTVCNEGSKDHSANFIVLVIAGIVLIAVVVGWKVSGRIIQKRRDRTLAEAQERAVQKRKKLAQMSQQSESASEEEDILRPREDADLAPLLEVSRSTDYVIDISFDHLGLVLPSGKAVLNGVTGEIRSSRVCAVMGPSGAGKVRARWSLCSRSSLK